MQIIKTPTAMSALAQDLRQQGKRLALVPTMGNLHAGHCSLVKAVKPLADAVVVSIFVNPLQFGPQEDFANYPRTFDQDCARLQDLGVNYVFAPEAADMYPGDIASHTFIKVPGLSDLLCGLSRPGHFQGVATVVCKLFQVVQPTLAIFGEKDYQQLCLIRKMVADLGMPIEILGAPIVREPSGLAMSSRNHYLSAEQRSLAPRIFNALTEVAAQAQHHDDYETLTQQATEALNQAGFKTDYLAIRRQGDLQPPTSEDKKLIVLAAAFLGQTRLIDNLIFEKA